MPARGASVMHPWLATWTQRVAIWTLRKTQKSKYLGFNRWNYVRLHREMCFRRKGSMTWPCFMQISKKATQAHFPRKIGIRKTSKLFLVFLSKGRYILSWQETILTWWIGGYIAFKHTGHSNSSRTLLDTVTLGFTAFWAGSFTLSPMSIISSLWGGSMTSGLLRMSSKNELADAIVGTGNSLS